MAESCRCLAYAIALFTVLLMFVVVDFECQYNIFGALPAVAAATTESWTDPTTQYVRLSNIGAQERALCSSSGRCQSIELTCPPECPSRMPSVPTMKACFIDCTPSKCQTSCRSRKLKCDGYGAVCYDPRFVGGDGVMFYFHGKANENYCLLSDSSLHINARFIGTRPASRNRDFTWVEALGIMYNDHKLSVAAKWMGVWDDKEDRFSFEYDHTAVPLFPGESSPWYSPGREVRIERTAEVNSANIIVHNLMEADVSIVPITKEENEIHKYQLKLNKDCFAHMDIQFKFLNLSATVDGILGQTYKPDYINRVKVGVPMPIMGGESKFWATSLLTADCKASKFAARVATSGDAGVEEQQAQLGRISESVLCRGGGGFACRR